METPDQARARLASISEPLERQTAAEELLSQAADLIKAASQVRHEAIREMAKVEGLSHAAISEKTGISRQRVHQIVGTEKPQGPRKPKVVYDVDF